MSGQYEPNQYQPPPYQPNPYAPQGGPPQQGGSRGVAITGLVLAIVGAALDWVPILGFILAAVGLVLSIVGKKNGAGGISTAGIIVGAIGAAGGFIFTIVVCAFGFGEMCYYL